MSLLVCWRHNYKALWTMAWDFSYSFMVSGPPAPPTWGFGGVCLFLFFVLNHKWEVFVFCLNFFRAGLFLAKGPLQAVDWNHQHWVNPVHTGTFLGGAACHSACHRYRRVVAIMWMRSQSQYRGSCELVPCVLCLRSAFASLPLVQKYTVNRFSQLFGAMTHSVPEVCENTAKI